MLLLKKRKKIFSSKNIPRNSTQMRSRLNNKREGNKFFTFKKIKGFFKMEATKRAILEKDSHGLNKKILFMF